MKRIAVIIGLWGALMVGIYMTTATVSQSSNDLYVIDIENDLSDEDLYVSQDTLVEIKDPCELVWNPKPDITAYELSLALNALLAFDQESFDAMPESVKRHFDGSCE